MLSILEVPVAERRRWFALVTVSVAVSLIIVDSTIVNVAIPSIVDDLGIDSTQVQWVQESYTLVFASLLLVLGVLADRWGRRRVMMIGVAVFAASSLLAALAPTGSLLIVARLVQGLGGAMILPTTLSIINATFRGRERGIAFAVWGSTIGGMAALGPLLGGWLTTDYSWRWAFGINIPIAVVILVAAALVVDESRADDDRGTDLVAALLSVMTFGGIVFGLIEGRSLGWWTTLEESATWWPLGVSPVPFALAIGVLGAVLFVTRSRRRAAADLPTLVPLELFTIASFRNGNVAALVVSLGEFGILLSLPIWLQNVLGYDALATGWILVALAGGSFLASGAAQPLTQRFGAVAVVRAGITAEIVGVVGLGLVASPTSTWQTVVPFLAVYGFGVGLATAQLTGVVLADVPVEASGAASGTQSTARQVGSALGIAILGTVLFTSTAATLDARLEADGVPADQRSTVVSAVVDSSGGAIAGLAQDERTAAAADDARDALTQGTRYSAWAAGAFLLLGLGATLTLGRRTDDERAGSTT
ncbi:EmrB/QacA subfamily drug resistance transporter [Sediminihabitans luteus]|uniref:EmrB/QacA subfamily drug resistance transporter n=1 Tax=Sediminihabitans luteus TaxID=1138585 RepID=A0A2M9D1K7_9CELL|nr:MFS transporter [Sediminihabitans luteus]PJJ77965.1 EmrB/QacA subfamily drug resistance transporter [Sediminihabitans luteus]GIJ00594.1 MFS transporter [Sediminihabitans luteus]